MTSQSRKAVLGIFLVLIGTLYLLRNLGQVDLPYWLFSWQMLLIALGAFNLFTGNRSAGVILLAIGGLFLLQDLYYLRFRDYWPIILIAVGLSFILSRKSTSSSGSITDAEFNISHILSGGKHQVSSHKLQFGKVSSILGGAEIDLRESKPVDGAVIDLFMLFGGVTIKVPDDWNIKMEVSSVLGGFEMKSKNTNPQPGSPTVIFRGTAILGGGEIK